jgi:hypothetical protein
VKIRWKINRAALQVVAPPVTQFATGDCLGELLRRYSCDVLMDQTVECGTLLKEALVLQRWFRLDSGPAQAAHIAQLESPGAVDVVLETALTELEIVRQAHWHSSHTHCRAMNGTVVW